MIARASTWTLIATLGSGALVSACQGPESEFREALPSRQDVMVDVPSASGSSPQGLHAESKAGSLRQAIVGQPAEFYTDSYYVSRDLNALAGFLIEVLEAITKTKPSGLTETSAVWGPLSQPLEPNEYILNVDKKAAGPLHYVWKLEGKPKGQSDDHYLVLAGGAFEPGAKADRGRGWFAIEFDNIHQLNPTDKSHGRIEYALGRGDDGTLVFAHYKGPADDGTPTEAFYAYGIDTKTNGFMVFAFQGDIDNGKDGKVAKEDVLIHTRWNSTGSGRADVFATKGDLGTSTAIASQCWGKTFVSSYETISIDGSVLETSGDASTCAFADTKVPKTSDLPKAADLINPHPVDGMKP
jgi:hypothetical protein